MSGLPFSVPLFAELSGKFEKQDRLFILGYEISQALLKDIQGETISAAEKEKIPVGVLFVLTGPSIEFIVGRIYSAAVNDANDSVEKIDSTGLTQFDPTKWADDESRRVRAGNKYSESNCSLLRV